MGDKMQHFREKGDGSDENSSTESYLDWVYETICCKPMEKFN